jgi:hypothetical protein
LYRDVRITVTKLDLLDHVGWLVLSHLSELSAREAELNEAHPTGAERYQYAIDAIAKAMASEVDSLIHQWGVGPTAS